MRTLLSFNVLLVSILFFLSVTVIQTTSATDNSTTSSPHSHNNHNNTHSHNNTHNNNHNHNTTTKIIHSGQTKNQKQQVQQDPSDIGSSNSSNSSADLYYVLKQDEATMDFYVDIGSSQEELENSTNTTEKTTIWPCKYLPHPNNTIECIDEEYHLIFDMNINNNDNGGILSYVDEDGHVTSVEVEVMSSNQTHHNEEDALISSQETKEEVSSSSSETSNNDDKYTYLQLGVVMGGIIGGIIVLLCITLLIIPFLYIMCYKKSKFNDNDVYHDDDNMIKIKMKKQYNHQRKRRYTFLKKYKKNKNKKDNNDSINSNTDFNDSFNTIGRQTVIMDDDSARSNTSHVLEFEPETDNNIQKLDNELAFYEMNRIVIQNFSESSNFKDNEKGNDEKDNDKEDNYSFKI